MSGSHNLVLRQKLFFFTKRKPWKRKTGEPGKLVPERACEFKSFSFSQKENLGKEKLRNEKERLKISPPTLRDFMKEQPVAFKNSKGMQLVGMLHIPKGKGKFPAVIFCHGFGGDKVDEYRMHVRNARALCKEGFLVLRFDFHGHGDSEGEFRNFRVTQEFDDLRCAMNLVKKQKSFNGEIGLVGHSLGGAIALITAAKNKDISAVVALAPVTNWRQIKFLNEIVEAEMKGVVERRSDILSKDLILDMTKHNPIDRVNEISCPVLIVHGTKDDAPSLKGSRGFIQTLKAPKKLVVIGGADHCFKGYKNTMAMIKETVSWFKRYF